MTSLVFLGVGLYGGAVQAGVGLIMLAALDPRRVRSRDGEQRQGGRQPDADGGRTPGLHRTRESAVAAGADPRRGPDHRCVDRRPCCGQGWRAIHPRGDGRRRVCSSPASCWACTTGSAIASEVGDRVGRAQSSTSQSSTSQSSTSQSSTSQSSTSQSSIRRRPIDTTSSGE